MLPGITSISEFGHHTHRDEVNGKPKAISYCSIVDMISHGL